MKITVSTLLSFAVTGEHVLRTFVKLPIPPGVDDEVFNLAKRVNDDISNGAIDNLILDTKDAALIVTHLVSSKVPTELVNEVAAVIAALYHTIADHALQPGEIPSAPVEPQAAIGS